MNIEGLDYNTQREPLLMPEYGREIQKMVDYAVTLPTKEERLRCAETIVRMMVTKVPQLRDNANYEQTLWDHLYLMSHKQLDIDWPYDVSEAEKILGKPQPMPLPQKGGRVRLRHYGRLIEEVLAKLKDMPEGPERDELVRVTANQMKTSESSGSRSSCRALPPTRSAGKNASNHYAMASFIIEGGHPLSGTITPQGAKNEALEVIAATLLTADEVVIRNIPDIRDVNNLILLLRDIGVKVERRGRGEYAFRADRPDLGFLGSDEFVSKCAELRGSVLLIGPLLARFGKAVVATPGGDKIGRRRLDTHFLGFKALGAQFRNIEERNVYEIGAASLEGCYMLLDEASVTGTANIIMAAVCAKGTTTIYNAACEPYIQQLCHLLNRMGARISGIGSNLLTIVGTPVLHGATHDILPDASVRNLGIIPEAFRRLGVRMAVEGDDIVIPKQGHYQVDSFIDGTIMTLADAPWPGLTPDLISVLIVVATQARGSVLFHQKMFESRLFFVDKLIDMGAQIILCDPHRAVVVGHDHRRRLRAGRMASPDIRAGIALLIAAMSAQGTSRIDNIEQIDRGYEDIEVRLGRLGARIERIG